MNKQTECHRLLRWAGRWPFLTTLAGALLLLLCFPPFRIWPLAWVAVIPWIALIATPRFEASRPMLRIWLGAVLFWAAEAYYISIPHPLLWIAWVMLFVYLSFYPLLFVWIGRKLVHGQRVSLLLAAPIVFTALEWVRAHMLTGFGFSMLANSQYEIPLVLQVCDVAGGYGLTFLMVSFSAGLWCAVTACRRRGTGIVTALFAVAVVSGYGLFCQQKQAPENEISLSVAVIQGNVDTRFPETEREAEDYHNRLFQEYLQLQLDWLKNRVNSKPLPQLIVWPEGKYPIPHVLSGGDRRDETIRRNFREFHEILYRDIAGSQNRSTPVVLPPMIVGTTTIDPESEKAWNSALLLDRHGHVVSQYHKMHLVPFGEFIPFGQWFPILKRLTPVGSGFDAGDGPVGFRFGNIVAAPSVCFESAVSHLIRESVNHLRASGSEPNLLINVTDDGWFYGHAVLDHHLACNVMRAIENRKPVIVAANTGFSALIQSDGRVLRQGPRRKSEVIEMTLPLRSGRSLYSIIGDWPVIALTVICVLGVVVPSKTNDHSEPVEANEE